MLKWQRQWVALSCFGAACLGAGACAREEASTENKEVSLAQCVRSEAPAAERPGRRRGIRR